MVRQMAATLVSPSYKNQAGHVLRSSVLSLAVVMEWANCDFKGEVLWSVVLLVDQECVFWYRCVCKHP